MRSGAPVRVVTAASSSNARAPTQAEKRAFVIVVVLYGALALGVIPWATAPGLVNPHITAMAGTAILVADLCTALLLGAWYRASGRPALLALTLGYFYGGIMAALHLLTYPGALLPAPFFGNEQTVTGCTSPGAPALQAYTWLPSCSRPRVCRSRRRACGRDGSSSVAR